MKIKGEYNNSKIRWYIDNSGYYQKDLSEQIGLSKYAFSRRYTGKMASDKIVVSKGKVTAVADAIREKAGTSIEYTLDQMPTAIAEIQTGGGSGEDFYIDDASYLFYGGARLNKLTVFLGKLKNVTNMDQMFYNCSGLTSLL